MTLRRLFPILILLILAAAVAPLLRPPEMHKETLLSGLPWQISTHEDGSSTVFGIRLGQDSLADARQTLGEDLELAILQDQQEAPSLEMYYSRHTAGVLQGKLILTGELDPQLATQMITRSGVPKYLESGVRKYHLQREDIPLAQASRIQSIAFLPSANLDEAITRKRFGPEDRAITDAQGSLHLLYARLGLDVTLNTGHRDVLQYVAPRDFRLLQQPLLENQ